MGRPKGFCREEVLSKSAKVFWEKGFADTSLTDLVEATGVAKSGLFAEFENKDGIFTNCIKKYAEEAKAFDVLSKLPLGLENIKIYLTAVQTCSAQKGCFVGNSMREAAILPQEANKIMAAHQAHTRDLIFKNLEAAGFGKRASMFADLTVTFTLGLGLQQNLLSSREVGSKGDEFFEMLRSQL